MTFDPGRSSRRSRLATAFLLACTLAAPLAQAAPIVAIDLDPDSPGVQDARTVGLAERFDVDVVISGLAEPLPLVGFQLDLDFDGAVASAVSTESGGILADPTFAIEDAIETDRVSFAEVALAGGAVGAGRLVRVRFAGASVGTSALALSELILAGPFGSPIAPTSVAGARLTVRPSQAPVPEPGAALAFVSGLALVSTAVRRSGRAGRAAPRSR